ncbi:MAG TPA: HAD family hydrolase [Treponema sp.]|nr:HAD family hydrolase [Treponema sp.]
MRIYRIPQKTRTIIFDIDGTLYTDKLYVFEQVDAQVRHFAHIRGISEQAARHMIAGYRKTWSASHGGKKISLGNTFAAFGIPIETSVKWREMLLAPEHYLHPDPLLQQTISTLKERFALICVTNNPVAAARRTLAAIGADTLLPDIIGLDTCGKSKPAKEVLELAAERTATPFSQCLSVGDRYDIDVALPLELGMGGIVVSGVEEVYQLPELLCPRHIAPGT